MTPDAASRPKGAAAREQDGVDALHEVAGVEQVRLPCAGRRTAHIDAGDSTLLGQDHGAAGRAPGVGEVADPHAGHVGDGAAEGSRRRCAGSLCGG